MAQLYGYKPSVRRRALQIMCRIAIRVFRLHGRSIFSNEFMQSLDPQQIVNVDGARIRYRTGNGRLLWRVQTFQDDEPLLMSWIHAMDSRDVVLDIGANVGMYTIPAAMRVKCVYACELDPLNVAILRENIYMNSLLDKVIILPFACGHSMDLVDVRFRDLAYGDALQLIERGDFLDTRLGSRSYTAKVLQLSLDTIFAELAFPRPNKIKIDVDGNEQTMLEGLRRLISSADEVYLEDGLTFSCQNVIAHLEDSGFEQIEISEMFSRNIPDQMIGTNRLFRKIATDGKQ